MLIKKAAPRSIDEQSSFTFSCTIIKQQAAAISQLCKELDIELFFAVKSCSDLRFIELISPFIDGFDVSNLNELKLIENYDKKISFFSPILLSEEVELIDKIVDSISVEETTFTTVNAQKYYRFDLTSLFLEKTQSRFGIDYSTLENCTDVEAIHIHVRELHEYDSADFINVIKKLLLKFPYIKAINLGGGWHKVVGKEGYKVFLSNIRKAFPFIKLRIEPGRFFSMNSGVLKSRVMKIDMNRKVIVVDISSMLHLLWCTPELFSSSAQDKLEITIYGSTCFEHDVIGKFSVDLDWFSQLKIGDYITFTGLSTYTIQRQGAFNGIKKLDVHWQVLS